MKVLYDEIRDVIGYEGRYKVSSMGYIISYVRDPNGRLMYPTMDKDGYLQIGIRDIQGNRWYYRLHRIVAEAFIPNPNNYAFVNHKDNVPYHNVVGNLEWCTIEYNNKYRFEYGKASMAGENHPVASMTNSFVREFYIDAIINNLSTKQLQDKYNIPRNTAQGVKNKRIWLSVTDEVDKEYLGYVRRPTDENFYSLYNLFENKKGI